MRAHPGTHAAVVGTLDEGASVDIARRGSGRWVEIRSPVHGYVWAQYLRRVCEP
ncbi:MAG: SH3 domain-containing protein [Sandaracinaceae bacterium]